MTDYIDAILHIADLPALAAAIAAVDPSKISPSGTINGFASTPATMQGVAALVYVRMTPDEAAQWRGTPLVTILAEAEYTVPETADAVYAALSANPASMALYDAVYPRDPVEWTDENGETQSFSPPFMFGVMG